ncbi:MAG: hypothetical protein AAFV45_05550 [Pseudomonadota bacterium]
MNEPFDCKRMTGSMQIRILQLRTFDAEKQSSSLSRILGGATTSLFGGTTLQSPDGRYESDMAQLKADNAKLAAAGCKIYDLDAEMAETDMRKTPRPR